MLYINQPSKFIVLPPSSSPSPNFEPHYSYPLNRTTLLIHLTFDAISHLSLCSPRNPSSSFDPILVPIRIIPKYTCHTLAPCLSLANFYSVSTESENLFTASSAAYSISVSLMRRFIARNIELFLVCFFLPNEANTP